MVMRRPASHITGVVVGVDGSAAAAAALRWAATEACRRQVALRIVSAWEERDRPGPRRSGAPARIARARVHKGLARVLSRQRYPRRIVCATPRGAPGQALLSQAGEHDLLVLGITGVSAGPAPGPVNWYCLRYGHGPLVFVPALPSG